jgi:hypothetical protein
MPSELFALIVLVPVVILYMAREYCQSTVMQRPKHETIPIKHSGVIVVSHFARGSARMEPVKDSSLIGSGLGVVCGGRSDLFLRSFLPPHLPP